jgi:hypothetical protein
MTDFPEAKLLREGDRLYDVEPRTETRIPGTSLVVWHDGSVSRWVNVLDDGAVDLSPVGGWIVRAI